MRTRFALCLAVAGVGSAQAGKPPSLDYVAPLEAPAAKALAVEASLLDGESIRKLVVRYRGPGEDYAEVVMEPRYGDLYRATIPAAKLVPPGVELCIEGEDASGKRLPLFMTAKKPARIYVKAPDGG